VVRRWCGVMGPGVKCARERGVWVGPDVKCARERGVWVGPDVKCARERGVWVGPDVKCARERGVSVGLLRRSRKSGVWRGELWVGPGGKIARRGRQGIRRCGSGVRLARKISAQKEKRK
jgi:predicted RNA-binding protein YlxR (DUF448 family)